MIYLFLGEATELKEARIQELRARTLPEGDARHFDYEGLHGKDADSATLKKALLTLPAISSHRFILIRESQHLDEHNLQMILETAQACPPYLVLALESDVWTKDAEFVRKITSHAKITEIERPEQQNIFAVTRLMAQRQSAEALRVLGEILEQGTHPLQILGGLVWFWGKQRGRLDGKHFEMGLRALQEADLNIKRSRIDPSYAVEIAVVKLSAMLR